MRHYAVRVINCKAKFNADHLAGVKLTEKDFDTLVGGDEACEVYKPDGSPLIKYRPGYFEESLCSGIIKACRRAAADSYNRGTAAGLVINDKGQPIKRVPSYTSNPKIISKTLVSASGKVKSGIIGYFNRTSRLPFCRQTSFLINEAASWNMFLPYIRKADAGFKELMPDKWNAQNEWVQKTPSDWVIPESTFTTVTVNRNFQTATHKDAGDLKQGFGVMSCLRNNKYSGSFLVFPAYRIALDMSHGCLCLADVHEWHGNTQYSNIKVGYERISLVFYYREKMIECKAARDEIKWAKGRKSGEPLKD